MRNLRRCGLPISGLLLALCIPIRADWKDTVKDEINSTWKQSKVGIDRLRVTEPGTIFVLQKDGITGDLATDATFSRNTIVDGQVRAPKGVVAVLQDKRTNHLFTAGDKAYLWKVAAEGDDLILYLLSYQTYSVNENGGRSTQMRYKMMLDFKLAGLPSTDWNHLKAKIVDIIRPENEAKPTEAKDLSLNQNAPESKTVIISQSAAAPVQASQKQTSIDDVIEMGEAGLTESLIITTLRKEGQTFNLRAADMVRLKQAGISDAVIQTMIDPSGAVSTLPAKAVPATAAPVAAAANPSLDIGVYSKKDGNWVEVLPEVVNWKTGGVVKHIATAGVVKGDVNGNIQGPNSHNSVKTPLEFMIVTAEGVSITEYQLIRMRPNRNYREFRTVTGGIMHVEGGATRDLVPFEQKKTGSRTFEIVLPSTIGAGEYGFLPPGAVTSASSASLGKMYTFRVIE